MKSTFKVLFFLKRNHYNTAEKVRNVFLGKKKRRKHFFKCLLNITNNSTLQSVKVKSKTSVIFY